MKILQVNPFFAPCHGGSAVAPYEISRQLKKMGHEVFFYTSDYKFSPEWASNLNGVNVFPFWTAFKKSNFFITPNIISAAKATTKMFDAVILNNYRTFQNIVVAYYARKYKIPYILEAHGSLPVLMGNNILKKFFDLQLGLHMLSEATGVIALNSTEATQYKSMGVPLEKIHIIPHGIDLSAFNELPPFGEFRSKFGISDQKKIILFLGRIHAIKGLDTLISAFANIAKKFSTVQLVIVGPDDGYLNELKISVISMGIQNRVIFTGPLYEKEKIEAYVDADVYVLPSKYEIFGISAIESIACGTPVILTKNCGLANDLKDRVGLVFDANSVADLEAALVDYLTDNQKQELFRKNCRTMAQKYDIIKRAKAIEALLKKIAAKQPNTKND